MTVVIKDSNGSFREKALGWAGCPIDTAGLEVAHFFGGTLENSLRNFTHGKANSTVIGTPTVKANSVALQGRLNLIQTAMADTNESTLVVVFKPLEIADAIIIGNLVSPANNTTRRLAMAYSAPMTVTGFRTTDQNQSGATTSTALAVGAPVCLALRNVMGATPLVTFNNLTKGEVGTMANPGPPVLGGAIRIGGAYNVAGYDGKTEVYAALGFSRKLTDAELGTLYAWLKAYCASRAIPI